MLPDDVHETLADRVNGTIQEHEPVGGGCIASAGRLVTSEGPYFLKWAEEDAGQTFEAEAAGLRALREAGSALVVPEVLAAQDADGEPGFLLTEWIETGQQPRDFWQEFGEELAALHRPEEERPYGFEQDNFIGELPQRNDDHERWPVFFRKERLLPQAEIARERGYWNADWDDALDKVLARLDELLPEEPPASTLHGDLWSGNFMMAANGEPALFDPATYYGHRETDLAMTELFGGFRKSFYEAYRAAWSLEPGYEDRRAVYNLYHLINHLNHFGRSYAGRVERTLQRFA
jgi:fructosamine-3-kinase